MSLPNVLITAGWLTAITVTVIVLRRRAARKEADAYRREDREREDFAAWQAQMDADETEAPS